MPKQARHKTPYVGVYFIVGKAVGTAKPERIYYISYRRNGKLIEEKAGRQFQDDMTPAKASRLRGARIDGKALSNEERRKQEAAQKKAVQDRWSISRLWASYKSNKDNLKGLATDENRFKNHIEPFFGNKLPSEIDPLSVDRLRVKLLKTKKPGTVRNVLELLRRISNYGVNKNLTEGIRFTIEMPRLNNAKTEDLTSEQLRSLLDAMDRDSNIQAANLMRMVLYTGMRRSELFKLRWEDIDEQRGFVNIVDPKGGPDQKIPLNDAARELLNNHPASDSEYVFPGRNGGRRVDIHHQVNRIRDNAGLPKDFRAIHGLRHVYGSMMASSGQVDMYTLQKLLTHKSPLMTQRYAHLRDEALKRASDLASDIIKDVAKKGGEKVENLYTK